MANHAILNAKDHLDLRVATTTGWALGDAVMSCLIVPSEFRRVQNEYPILFRLTPERDHLQALALFGFETGENLFLKGDRWEARYRPLAMQIQPFLIGQPTNASGEKQVHIDLSSLRIATGEEGMRVFDELGRPTPYLENIADHLGELDAGWQGTGDFFAALQRYELLEPLTLEITLEVGSLNRLVGYHSINEERLAELDAAALGDLHGAGHLLPIFMALASLSNVSDLIARKDSQARNG